MPELRQLLSLEYGAALPAELRSGDGYPVFGSSGEVGRHTESLVSGPGVVVGRKGSVGKVSWADQPFWPIDTSYWVNCTDQDKRWIYWLLSWLPLVELDSSTGIPGLNRNDVYELDVYEPPNTEKRLLVQILDTLDTSIRQTEAIIAKLKQVKQGLLHDLLTRGIAANGELRPPQSEAPHLYKASPLGWIPVEWNAGPVETFLERIIDYRGKTPEKTEIGVPLITARNVRLGFLDPEPREFIHVSAFEAWMTRGLPKRGDILFTMEAPLGNVAQIETDERLAFAQRLIIMQATEGVRSTFLKYLLLGAGFRSRLFALGSGSTVEGIQQSTLRRIPIALPTSLDEQDMIAQRLSELDRSIDSEAAHMEKSLSLKSGLMDDLLTGRVRVTPLLKQEVTT